MLRGWIPILTKGIEITFFAIISRPIGKDIKKQTKQKLFTKCRRVFVHFRCIALNL